MDYYGHSSEQITATGFIQVFVEMSHWTLNTFPDSSPLCLMPYKAGFFTLKAERGATSGNYKASSLSFFFSALTFLSVNICTK